MSLGPVSPANVSAWLDCEKHINGFGRVRPNNPYAAYTQFPSQYTPGAESFQLPYYQLDAKKCLIFTSRCPNPALSQRYLQAGEGRVLFPVHPVNLGDPSVLHIDEIARNAFQNVRVSATSSTRTVFVLDSTLPLHCVKPHTNLRITKWRRHMEDRKVEHAVAVTRILERSPVFEETPRAGYFPETIGIVYGNGSSRNEWGFIVREMQSKPPLSSPYKMIPLNSLYLSPVDAPEKEPILVDMIRRSKKEPKEFILDEIIKPLIDGWFNVYLKTGVLFEPHGQNVIVEIDESTGKITRFSHRDFDCDVNEDLLLKNGFTKDGLYEHNLFSTQGSKFSPQGCHLSAIFDKSFKVVLEGLADVGERYFNVPKEEIRERCKAFLYEQHPQVMKEHFPEGGKVYNLVLDEESKEIVFQESPERPTWR